MVSSDFIKKDKPPKPLFQEATRQSRQMTATFFADEIGFKLYDIGNEAYYFHGYHWTIEWEMGLG